MRLATYNVENLFNRAKAMNLEGWAEGKPTLERFAKLNGLLGQQTYSEADKQSMVRLLDELGLSRSDRGPFVLLRQNRGSLVKRPRNGGITIVANGRYDGVGSAPNHFIVSASPWIANKAGASCLVSSRRVRPKFLHPHSEQIEIGYSSIRVTMLIKRFPTFSASPRLWAASCAPSRIKRISLAVFSGSSIPACEQRAVKRSLKSLE